jgi:DeoR/GlpR family transcriptional regulator of sugar metabolism
MNKYQRRDQVLDYIVSKQHVSVMQVCETFDVSEATARRILNELAQETKIERVRGGAIALQVSNHGARGYLSRSVEQHEEKLRIGKKAAGLVQDGDTVFLGGGTTVSEVAYHLRERRSLTVMTNSLAVMDILKDADGVQLIGLGGILWRSEQSFIGHITEQAMQELHPDKVITGIRAIDVEKGLMNRDPMCTQTERAILGIAREVIIAADYTKCGRVDTAFIAPLDAMTTLVTDDKAPSGFVSALTARGIHVIQA